MEKYHENTVEYWKQNAEENYLTTPISVLKYITVLEEQAEQLRKHAVMPSYLQEVEKEAFIMIQKYGKKRAEEEAILIAESYIEDINNLEYYNAEKIDLWDKRKFFWLEVVKCVRDWA